MAAAYRLRLSDEVVGRGCGRHVTSCCARRQSPARLEPFTPTTCTMRTAHH